jgi:thioredoxin-related protein
MKIILFILIASLYTFFAQGQGVKFEEGVSWQQILNKARESHKYIFMDCFTTWCGPCKEMDKEIYTNRIVGNFLNAEYISIKMQMDTSKSDSENVRSFYHDAHSIQDKYWVTAYPSFLFFSEDGKIVNKGIGYKDVNEFMEMAKNSLDPEKQYYTLLENYQDGNRNYSAMPYMAQTAEALGDNKLALAIAQNYINNYLSKLSERLYTKENIGFVAHFVQSDKDWYFPLFYRRSKTVDGIMNIKGFSQGVVDFIITKEEIDPVLWRDDIPITENPDWKKMSLHIANKFSRGYAERTILGAQLRWYNYKKDWPALARYNIKKLERYGMDTAGLGAAFLNDMIWEVIFLHSNDKAILAKGIRFMRILLKNTPNDLADIDTYANLLYKLGRTKESISLEKKAVEIENENAIRDKRIPDKVYQETLDKMIKGEPTWVAR